jgi:NADH-quinone oxidoreductase subunit H
VDPSVTSLLLFVILVALKSLILILLLLGTIAFYILVERHILGAIQRRKGPNVTGSYGLLQSIADGLKLISKETPIPSSSNSFW